MEENAKLTDNIDPYSPYETSYNGFAQNQIASNDLRKECIHQVICPNCDTTWHISVNKVNL